MAFGQPTGPPAGHRQMAELLELLQGEGFEGYRDARGPMGFTQRQGNGKFTSDEADGFIAQLYEQVEQRDAAAGETPPIAPPPPTRQKISPAERALRSASDEELLAELQRRGWETTGPR